MVTVDSEGVFSLRSDFSGVAMFYSRGLGPVSAAARELSSALFVASEPAHALSRGAIGAVWAEEGACVCCVSENRLV